MESLSSSPEIRPTRTDTSDKAQARHVRYADAPPPEKNIGRIS
jgi:hypothetical protein